MSDVLILCYHAVSHEWPASRAVRPERLEAQIRMLLEHGFRGTTFTQAVLEPPAPRTLAVTFDDGYQSTRRLAAPILEKLGIPGTVFIPTSYILSGEPMSWEGSREWLDSPWATDLTPMSTEEVRELVSAGWEIGSHTHDHPRLPSLGDGALREELEVSKSHCEKITGRECSSIAYPYGDYEERVVLAAAAAGYRAGGTLPQQIHPVAPLAWPRLYVSGHDDQRRFALKVNRLVRRVRTTRAWDVLQRVRTARERAR